MIAPDKARELTRIARDLFVKEFEKENPEICENIQKEIELAAANCKTGLTSSILSKNSKKGEELIKYLKIIGFTAALCPNWEIWVVWKN
jgi:hypothetical protein